MFFLPFFFLLSFSIPINKAKAYNLIQKTITGFFSKQCFLAKKLLTKNIADSKRGSG